jgi:hypothetical protein
MTYSRSESIFETTKTVMGTRVLEAYDTEGMEEVMNQYSASESLPKLMDKLDVYIHLGNALNNVWSGGDVSSAITTIQEAIE